MQCTYNDVIICCGDWRLTSQFIKSMRSPSDLAAGTLTDGLLDGVAGTRSAAVERSPQHASNSSFDACAAPHVTLAPLRPAIGKHAVDRCTTGRRHD